MKWTGERLVTQIVEPFTYEHLHRYFFSMQFVNQKNVLDIASGEGYGSNLLAKKAKRVIGVDVDQGAVDHASVAYVSDNLEFIQGDIKALDFEDATFDVITCFETIEHVKDHHKSLKELTRVLKADGVLLISTPDRECYNSFLKGESNPFHELELNYREFSDLLKTYFTRVTFLFQKSISASVLIPEKSNENGLYEYRGSFDGFDQMDAKVDSMYFLCVCSNQPTELEVTASMLTYELKPKTLIRKILFRLKRILIND